MMDRKYTIIIVPRAGISLRKFHVSSRVLSYAFICLAALFLVSVGTMVHYIKLYRDSQNLTKVRQENDLLRASLQESQYLTQKLTRKISLLNNLSARLKVMAGLSQSGSRKHPAKPGLGGVSFSLQSADPRQLFDLQRKADNLERSLTMLHNYFQDRNSEPSILPAEGYISSRFGTRRNPFTGQPDFHQGVDITNNIGTPVVAAADGTVIAAEYRGSFGYVVEIRHERDVTTVYGHLQRTLVKPGEQVKQGQQIGLMGNSGKSTGPHLHYEVRVHDQAVNPRAYLNLVVG